MYELNAKIRESLRKSDRRKSDRGLKLSSKVRDTLAEFLLSEITDNFHSLLLNLLPYVHEFAFSQVFTCPRKSAAGLFADLRRHNRTYADFRGEF